MIKNNIDFVIYHHPCTDGFASAFIVWYYFKTNHKNITFYPAIHNETPIPDVTGKNVLICDFSYKKEILKVMISQANSLLIIDHHKSAKKELMDLDDKYKIFDMNHSGASLTWKFFFPDTELPYLIKLIEDRDIWGKKFKETKYFAAWFYLLPFENSIYELYLEDEIFLKKNIEEKGKSYYELNKKNILNALNYTANKFTKIGNKFYFVSYLNTSVLKSDIGNKILKYFPVSNFSCIYNINDKTDSTSFSLRSLKHHTDVSIIASLFNGGGHKCASGIKIDYITNTLPGIIYDKSNFYKNVIENIYFDELEFDGKIYNIVYLNSSVFKEEIGKYLLQTKYSEKIKNGDKIEKINIQNCCMINNYLNKKNPPEIKTYQIAAIWDNNNKQTNYIIIFNNYEQQKKNIVTTISYKGFVNKLDKTIFPNFKY
ncbi:Hypothetical protein KVN_LOCUS164 [uncultured virus]|nr:Hypothetical protein KVN_LOCUS164 [uncultured virus]